MGVECSKRFKSNQIAFTQESAIQAFKDYEKRLEQMEQMPVKVIKDKSDCAQFTAYEEQLHIRNVHLEEYEDRLKRFVFKVKADERKSLSNEITTIKKKQLQIAFEGNPHLEAMLTDKSCLDWRLIMQDNIFVVFADEQDHFREEESFEEDESLTFRVDELNLLGILYCKCEPEVRAERFYAFLQPGLDEHISNADRDLEVFVPLMGRICYEAMINCYNQEHEAIGSDKAMPDLIPENQDLHLLDTACREVLADEDIGFVEKVFGFQTRISSQVFVQQLTKDHYHFLQPHHIRSMVKQQLMELLATKD